MKKLLDSKTLGPALDAITASAAANKGDRMAAANYTAEMCWALVHHLGQNVGAELKAIEARLDALERRRGTA